MWKGLGAAELRVREPRLRDQGTGLWETRSLEGGNQQGEMGKWAGKEMDWVVGTLKGPFHALLSPRMSSCSQDVPRSPPCRPGLDQGDKTFLFVLFWANLWLSGLTPGSILRNYSGRLEGPCGMPGIKPGSAVCKAKSPPHCSFTLAPDRRFFWNRYLLLSLWNLWIFGQCLGLTQKMKIWDSVTEKLEREKKRNNGLWSGPSRSQ